MSDVVWQALIAAAVTVVLAWMTRDAKRGAVAAAEKAEVKADVVAAKLEHSTADTDAKLDHLKKTTDVIHALSNSGSLALLKVIADLRRREAERPGSTEADREAAEAAEKQYREHKARQDAEDAKGK